MSATVVNPQQQAPPVLTPAAKIAYYIKLRDKIAAVKDAQAAQLKPFTDAMKLLESGILADLSAAGVDSMKSDAGTAYTVVHTSATVPEWSKTLDYIREHEAWELLEARVSKTAALAIVEETGAPIPGVKITQAVTLNVRRS